MMYSNPTRLCCLLLFVLVLGASAQDKAPTPTAPGNAPMAPQAPLYQDDGSDAVPEQAQTTQAPDTRPLTGAQMLTLGSSGLPSHLTPRLNFAQTVDSNSGGSSSGSDVTTLTSVSGQLELQRHSRTEELNAHYQGGGLFYANRSGSSGVQSPNSTFQRFGISQRVDIGRWSLLASDEVAYTSASALGGGLSSGFSVLGPTAGINIGSLANLNPNFLPAQNLLQQVGSQLSNGVVAEADYLFGRRSSISVTGNYGFIKSPDGNLIESNQEGVSVGYNRVLSAHDTIGVSYHFMQFGYPGFGTRLRDHTAQLMYGRRVTGRLSLQLAAGGGTTHINSGALSDNVLLWNAETSLHYAFRYSQVFASYGRSVNAGSGAQLGANSDTVSGGISRTFLRHWLTSTAVGFSRNAALSVSTGSYSTYFVNAGVRRDIGRYAGIFANYSLQKQTGSTVCSGCGTNTVRHIGTVGLDWGFRPIRIE